MSMKMVNSSDFLKWHFILKIMDFVNECCLYSLMNMRQLHISFNPAKTWRWWFCWFLCFALNLPELNLNLFWTSEQNNFGFSSGKFGAKHKNQQTITRQVLAELNEIWICLIFIFIRGLTKFWDHRCMWPKVSWVFEDFKFKNSEGYLGPKLKFSWPCPVGCFN